MYLFRNVQLLLNVALRAVRNASSVFALQGFLYKTRPDATGANLYSFDAFRAFIHATQFLKIRVPDLLGFVVGVADAVSDHGFLAAYLTDSGHLLTPLNRMDSLLNHKDKICKLFLGSSD